MTIKCFELKLCEEEPGLLFYDPLREFSGGFKKPNPGHTSYAERFDPVAVEINESGQLVVSHEVELVELPDSER